MTFLWPSMLLFLGILPLLVLLYVLIQRRRKRFAASYSSLGLVRSALNRGPGLRRHVPPLLFLVGLTVLILALARPQTEVSLPTIEGTVILAFDVSGSMVATDIQPTRLEAAKAAARSFIERQPDTLLIGIVAFSNGGLAVQAPTNNQDLLLKTIDRLSPQRGTSVGQGILASLNTIAVTHGLDPLPLDEMPLPGDEEEAVPTPAPVDSFPPSAILLLTDGENNDSPDPLEAAQAAADRDVPVYTIGIGSPAGTIIKVEGLSVHTTLNEELLQQISFLTGGEYFNAQSQEELFDIYENVQPALVIKPEKMEVTSIFSGASILILLISGMLSLLWFNRLP